MRAPALLGLALLCVLASCREPEPLRAPAAPVRPRATLVLEPPRIGVGQVGELELAVVTPPGHEPRAWTPPSDVEGVWVLETEVLPVEKGRGRWVHRTRVRLRPQGVGGFVWPGGRLQVEGPEGASAEVTWEEMAVEVPSLIPEYPGRTSPFGVRTAAGRAARPADVLGPAAAGALFALTCVGLVALARQRRRATEAESAPPAPAPVPPWQIALAALDTAGAMAKERPFDAAHATALALRRFVERRFGAPAAGRTTEELAATPPPFAVRSRWPAFVAVLEGLDAYRFRAESEPEARETARSRASSLVAEARHFVDDCIPPESRG